jgi:NADH:ubiquinone oxidoreductase subunit 3 (subunit A)
VRAFLGIVIIIGCILLVGLAYLWVKGDLAWVKPEPLFASTSERRS